MKCPKCGYLGFEDVDRCRNCGYDFSLTRTAIVPDLSLKSDTAKLGPLDDLLLAPPATPTSPTPNLARQEADVDRVFVASSASSLGSLSSGSSSRSMTPAELPLFGRSSEDDEPLIKTIPPPRAPLAVRRTTEIPRARTEQPRPQSLDLSPGAQESSAPDAGWGTARITARASADASAAPASDTGGVQPAAVGLRLLAVVIDLVILAGVDAIVIYFTLQICGITWDEISILPKGPLIAFLIVQNGGYLAAFTAGGQTLGKMIAGIRVVPNESNESLDLGTAITRTALWLLLAIPAGLGFLTVLGGDHRGLHDRFAGTRVVRASV